MNTTRSTVTPGSCIVPWGVFAAGGVGVDCSLVPSKEKDLQRAVCV